MKLLDLSTRALIPTEDLDPYPGDGTEDAMSEFAGRTITDLTDAVQAAIGVLALRDYERAVHQRRRLGPVDEREERVLLDECREFWTSALFGGCDEFARRVVEHGRAAWRGELA